MTKQTQPNPIEEIARLEYALSRILDAAARNQPIQTIHRMAEAALDGEEITWGHEAGLPSGPLPDRLPIPPRQPRGEDEESAMP